MNERKNKIFSRFSWFMLGSSIIFMLAVNFIIYSAIWRLLARQ